MDSPANADPSDAPQLDEGGLLRVGTAWVSIPDAQLPVVELLIGRYGRVVPREALKLAYVQAGCSGHPATVQSMVWRLSKRIAPLGLTLHVVRKRGIVLARFDDRA